MRAEQLLLGSRGGGRQIMYIRESKCKNNEIKF
jgi:hypothetical protein